VNEIDWDHSKFQRKYLENLIPFFHTTRIKAMKEYRKDLTHLKNPKHENKET
jgi:hypothetical protein